MLLKASLPDIDQDQDVGVFVELSVKSIVDPTQIVVVLAVNSATGGVDDPAEFIITG